MIDGTVTSNAVDDSVERLWAMGAIALWVAILLLGSRFGDARAWGFNHLAFLPPSAYWLTLAIGMLTLVAIWTRLDRHLWLIVARQPKVTIIVGLCVWLGAAIVFHAATPLLGDGWLRIDEAAARAPSQFVITEILPAFLNSWVFQSIGASAGWSARFVVAGMSTVGGILFAIGCLWLGPKALSNDARLPSEGTPLFGMILLFTGGWAILFFGYLELYAIAAALLVLFTLALLGHLNRRLHWAVPLAIWIVAVWSHLMALAWAPALVVALLQTTRRQSDRLVRTTLAIVIGVGTLVVIRSLEDSGIAFDMANYVLSLFGSEYSVFDTRHLVDAVNLFLLLFPAGLIALLPRWNRQRTWSLPVALIVVPSIVFWLLFNVHMGWARDWDLLTTASLPMLIVLIRHLNCRLAAPARTAKRTAAIGIAISSLVLWVWINTSTEASVARFSALLNVDTHTGSSGSETLARFWRERGAWDRAVAELARGLSLQPHPRLAVQRGIGFTRLNQPDSALAAFQYALELDPNNPDAQFGVGQTLTNGSRPEEALPFLERAVAIDSTRPDYRYYLGQALCQVNRCAEGLPHLAYAAQRNPSLPMLANEYGVALLELGRLDVAIRVFEEMTAHHPQFGPGVINLATAYWNAGDTNAANLALGRYERLVPEDQRAPIARTMRSTLDSIETPR